LLYRVKPKNKEKSRGLTSPAFFMPLGFPRTP
jgi:hypothetical protein